MVPPDKHFIESLNRDQAKSSATGRLRAAAPVLISEILATLFPHFRAKQSLTYEESVSAFNKIESILHQVISELASSSVKASKSVVDSFMARIPEIYKLLLLDSQAIMNGDPAAKSVDEVIICYPGFLGIAVYRFAHELEKLSVPLFPRILTEYAHRETGIDIHPAAQIGESFFIDHGTGIVIGETAIIKDNVRIYQGVTLGGLTVAKGLANKKRHPTIENNVTIYANATILGGETIIGENSIIGGSVWITSSIPANSTVYHKGDVIVKNQAV